jgi:hypothetical protein
MEVLQSFTSRYAANFPRLVARLAKFRRVIRYGWDIDELQPHFCSALTSAFHPFRTPAA